MGAAVAAALACGFAAFATVLSLAAYHSGVNVFAWSQQRAMTRFGYCWVTPEPRYQDAFEDGFRARVVRKKADGLWYAQFWNPVYATVDDWDGWESEIGFDTPMAAHVYAEVQGWRAP